MAAEAKPSRTTSGASKPVLVTHDQIEATTMADRIVIMNRSRIEQVGTADELYRHPANLFVAGFIGSPATNLVTPKPADAEIRVGAATASFQDRSLASVTVGLRPEHLRFATEGLPGRIVLVEPTGRKVLYEIETEIGVLPLLDPVHQIRHREGANVSIAVSPDNLLAFETEEGRSLPLTVHASGPKVANSLVRLESLP
jgi:inositol-phosphate transport system ATP-binding protein